MKHILFKENPINKYESVLLIKENAFRKDELQKHYIDPLIQKSIPEDSILALSLTYNENGKAPASLIKKSLDTLLKASNSLGVKNILCADSAYFKTLTGVKKVEPYHGYVLPCKIKGYEHINCILSVNYQSLFYNPDLKNKLTRSLDTLVSHTKGNHTEIGSDIIHYEYYPEKTESIKQVLNSLHKYPELTCDVETFSLKHYEAGIGTIAFAWDQHNGIAFPVDYVSYDIPQEIQIWDEKDKKYKSKIAYGYQKKNHEVYTLLEEFFRTYEGNLKFHNAAFDIKVLIYNLWMEDIIDTVGLDYGLKIMTENSDCTQIITYLAVNSCAGNKLALKDQAQEFAGSYAQDDINNIRLIPKSDLLRYNLTDCLCTWYVHNKNYPIMVKDNQEPVYTGIMKDSLITVIQMELTGMPMSMDEVYIVEKELEIIRQTHFKVVMSSPLVFNAVQILKQKFLIKDFNDRKSKAKHPENIKPKLIKNIEWEFNPNSGSQIAVLLHEVMGLPIIETTKTGQPSTDEDTLKALKNHTQNKEYQDLIQNIQDLSKVAKILDTFIPAFKKAQLAKDGIYYLFGSYKIGGTLSGRLSSSNPNLQNIPSGSTYGKLIKKCFKGNSKWLFGGADFNSLEDYINALLTNDPNKLKIYLEGYDSHSFRTKAYWPDKFKHIGNTPDEINSIKKTNDKERSDSKPITFALTYGGMFITLMKNCGFSEEEAKRIEANYHQLYEVSTAWVKEKMKQAAIDGFVTLAFGLRLRTPILKQVIWDNDSMPYEASAEARSAGNAVSGQSYGMLNSRAANELRKRIRNSPYKYDIKLCGQIHDAIYLLFKNDVVVVKWVNDNLVECMEWQELPEIQHDKVKLGAQLDLFYPAWHNGITLPNKASIKEIQKICKEAQNEISSN